MPNTGRPSRACYSCRQRRIKCDLVRPACGQCLRKRHACPGYRNELDARFQVQTMYSFEDYMNSDRRKSYRQSYRVHVSSRYETHFLHRPTTHEHVRLASSMPSTPDTSLSARWYSMTGPKDADFKILRPLGRWTTVIPVRLGWNEALDTAAIYALDACTAHFHPSEINARKVLVSAMKAVQSLRLAWQQATPTNPGELIDLMLTVQLHFSAEVFRRLQSRVYLLHMTALSTLLKSCDQSVLNTDIAQSIFSSIIYEEVVYSYFSGTDSTFDNPSFLQGLKSGILLWKSPLATVTAWIYEHLIQLPRALRLVRSLYGSQDPNIFAETVQLIKKLYNDDCDPLIPQIIENLATTIPTRSPENAGLVPLSYQFESTYIFKIFTRYFTFRILLYGLLQGLHQVYALDIDMAVVQANDVHTAYSMAMCVDHALHTYPADGLLCVRLILPLQFSFMSWHQLEMRSEAMESESAAADYQRATDMKLLVVRIVMEIDAAWERGQTSLSKRYEVCERLAQALGGGPQNQRLQDYTDTKQIIALAGDPVVDERSSTQKTFGVVEQ
ncbi:hypothetical protein BGW36DRAFT_403233 [Talaromyces proteolyticus]|uniref:Zn(2)-C6 fungal-type domain-containing protein n=1 Tax=Talaromyces proteolyticus TaxID=1131652 RepID=A0AAD4L189_9EURO|nr:uncharacterized protein BGW36DRAFT_403233 [Talaromyces proteolyticus]KAH8705708.1 hypothetical protein BGW36DRAFT_403233 [Talaromyces proteolyticus]